jgi:hypothetical protein
MPPGIYKRIKGINSGLVKGKHWKIKNKSKMFGHIPVNKGKHYKIKDTSNYKGKTPWNKGKKGLQKAWNKGLKGYHSGEQNYNWQGGISKEEYGNDWTDDLRESIRKRDNYICQECGIHQDELNNWFKKLDVHHIDYSKYNLDPNNLITLCRNCHTKTINNRDYWTEYFKTQINGYTDGKSRIGGYTSRHNY